MQNIDISQLRTFIAIANLRNFTRAALSVGLSQSAVTQQLNKLEKQLGVQLIERTKRNVYLTPHGEILLPRADKLILLNDQLISQFQEPEAEGEVSFGSPEDFTTNFLPDILSYFVHSHPDIHLKVCCELTLKLLEEFDKKNYDLIIIKQQPGQVRAGAKTLSKEQLVWVAQKKDLLHFDDIKEPINLVLSPDPCVYRNRALEALENANIPWQIVYTSPSVTGVVAAVRAGLGISVLPRNIVPDGLFSESVTAQLPALNETEICLLSHPDAGPAVKALEGYICSIFSNK